MSDNARKIYIDHLRAAATIAVIFIHSTAAWYGRIGEIDQISWWMTNLLNAASRFAVPVFVMISGAVLLGRSMTVGDFYCKRAVRLVPPIIFWSLVYFLFRIYKGMGQEELVRLLMIGSWSEGNTYVHLWYLSMFACLMLFAPFVNQFILGEKPSQKDLAVLLSVAALFFLLNSIADLARETSGIFMYWHLLFQWYIIYFIAGYYFDKYGDLFPVRKIFLAVLIIMTVLIGAGGNFLLIEKYHIVKDYLVMNDKGIVSLVLSGAVFLFFKKYSLVKGVRFVAAVSANSFGIYLLHPMILDLLSSFFYRFNLPGYLHIPAISLVTLALSYCIIAVMRKKSYFRKIC
ncbi:acyltransferase family protein [Desulfobulbus sp. TB]|nr:acyltransferase family protein [Desulfobulbus sp. TB]